MSLSQIGTVAPSKGHREESKVEVSVQFVKESVIVVGVKSGCGRVFNRRGLCVDR